jgi:hypothetical protein
MISHSLRSQHAYFKVNHSCLHSSRDLNVTTVNKPSIPFINSFSFPTSKLFGNWGGISNSSLNEKRTDSLQQLGLYGIRNRGCRCKGTKFSDKEMI